MKHSMKLVMALVLSGLGLAAAPRVEAVGAPTPTGDISITVTIQRVSVIVEGDVAFGIVSPGGEPPFTEEPVVVTNDGNVDEDYSLKLTDGIPPDPGTLTVGETEAAAGADTFVLQALFADTDDLAPGSADYGADVAADDDVVKATVGQEASTEIYAWGGNTADGCAVPATVTDVRDLYFKYTPPTSDAVTGGEPQALVVTLTASLSDGC